jgi:opacity protein-like surface antigen
MSTRNNAMGWRWGRCGACAAIVLLAGCAGGIHHQGEHQFSLTGSFGHPIKGEIGWPDGAGRADNAGVTLGYAHFLRDRLALLAQLTPYRNYNQSDGDVWTAEYQMGLRYYFCDFDVAERPVALFAEALGGIMVGPRSVPEDGAHANFTQDTGVGVEVHLADHVAWITGYRFRHLSHGHVFGDDPNPSQNDHQVYTGIAISF